MGLWLSILLFVLGYSALIRNAFSVLLACILMVWLKREETEVQSTELLSMVVLPGVPALD